MSTIITNSSSRCQSPTPLQDPVDDVSSFQSYQINYTVRYDNWNFLEQHLMEHNNK